MRIKRIWISEYKNLKDFEINFDISNPLNIIIGNNGSGKSNFLEVISLIFSNLFEIRNILNQKTDIIKSGKGKKQEILELNEEEMLEKIKIISFDYILECEIESYFNGVIEKSIVKINYNPSQSDSLVKNFIIDGQITTLNDLLKKLPESVYGYYSGETNRLKQNFKLNYENEEHKDLLFFDNKILPWIILTLFVFDSENSKTLKKFNLIDVISINIKFNTPKVDYDNMDVFHELEGEARETLKFLFNHGVSNFGKKEQLSSLVIGGYENINFMNMKDELLDRFISKEMFFENLMMLKNSGIIKNIEFDINSNQDIFSLSNLSEGEKQLLTIGGILEVNSQKNNMFVFDEPDTYLHPNWQRNLASIIEKIQIKGQIFLTTHSPLTLGEVSKENIYIFQDGRYFRPVSDTLNREVQEILEEVMQVSSRPIEIKNLITKFNKNIALRDIEQAKVVLVEIKQQLKPTDPFLVKANSALKRLEILNEKNN